MSYQQQPGVDPSAGHPVCPRHPDRVSYVRCQRCGRPVCPQCQRPAAVGVQCVDCVATASNEATHARSVERRLNAKPVVTYTLIALCVVSFVLQQFVDGWTSALTFAPFLGESEPWRFVTAGFVHGGIMHLALNMWCLWFVGVFLEPRIGKARFIALYLLSCIGGSVAVLWLATPVPYLEAITTGPVSWYQGTVGASGAVFGLFGAVALALKRWGGDPRSMLTVIGLNLVIGFVVQGISWQAHVGGLVTGVVLAAALLDARVMRSKAMTAGVIAAGAVLLIGLAMLRYAGVTTV